MSTFGCSLRNWDNVIGNADLENVGFKTKLKVRVNYLSSDRKSIRAFSINFKMSKEYL